MTEHQQQPDVEASDIPKDPAKRAAYVAIKVAGGTVKVAAALGYSRSETVRRWYVDRDIPPHQARRLVVLCGGIQKLPDLLPDVYGKLSHTELGYEVRGA
jgi:hypothetical protein